MLFALLFMLVIGMFVCTYDDNNEMKQTSTGLPRPVPFLLPPSEKYSDHFEVLNASAVEKACEIEPSSDRSSWKPRLVILITKLASGYFFVWQPMDIFSDLFGQQDSVSQKAAERGLEK